MDMNRMSALTVLVVVVMTHAISAARTEVYTNDWAVEVEGGADEADRLAAAHGMINMGEIIEGHFHFTDRRLVKRSLQRHIIKHNQLRSEPTVKWLEQQVVKKRVKRDLVYNDDYWPVWYLERKSERLDMNVLPAWEKGYTGKGVVVSILDDGLERTHPDLERNYDPDASTDINGNDRDPMPRYDYSNENKHGTRCAGEVSSIANNGICGVGIAYNSKIGGVRMLDGTVTDSVEARSLSLNPQHIDIYSASWGPDDDGRTIDGPGKLAWRAFLDGIEKGRGGKGCIFAWASGNGGRNGDDCNCDGYTNSIYTLSISSATEQDAVPWYSEACSSTLATTYSSGGSQDHQIYTTDLKEKCTMKHSGTSASAPLAAGICALVLESNPELTWRDMQHLVVLTARQGDLVARDWVTNGANHKVSHSFGFGLLDAAAMVNFAETWTNVPPQHVCRIEGISTPLAIPSDHTMRLRVTTDGCRHTPNHVVHLEHVQANISLTYSHRGSLSIYLTSPSLTTSTLLHPRSRDTDSRVGINGWPLMTTHNWGEMAQGDWILEIKNNGGSRNQGILKQFDLVLYGTATDPLQPYRPAPRATMPPEIQAEPEVEHVDWTESGASRLPAPDLGQQPSGPKKPSQATQEKLRCPLGFFLHTEMENATLAVHSCSPCHYTCLQCTGSDSASCLSCRHNYEKRDLLCVFSQGLESDGRHQLGAQVLVVVAVSIVSLAIFSLVFCLLQLHSYGCFCWQQHQYGMLDRDDLNENDGDPTAENGHALQKQQLLDEHDITSDMEDNTVFLSPIKNFAKTNI